MKPRPIFPNTTYLITRRTAGRQMLLTCGPDEQVNDIVEYLLAVTAERTGIQIHAVTVLGNHHHTVATDPDAVVPDFTRDFHGFTGRVLNRRLDRRGSLWDDRQTSMVRPQTPPDIVELIAYTLANPVHHRLVEHADRYPGLRAAWPETRKPVRRPAYFKDNPALPETATLVLHRPPGFDHLSDTDLADHIRERTDTVETQFRAAAYAAAALRARPTDPTQPFSTLRPFLGAAALRATSPFTTPSTPPAPRNSIHPHIAAADPAIRRAAIAALHAWRAAYNHARDRHLAGDPTALFPHGTYRVRRHYNLPVAPPPT